MLYVLILIFPLGQMVDVTEYNNVKSCIEHRETYRRALLQAESKVIAHCVERRKN